MSSDTTDHTANHFLDEDDENWFQALSRQYSGYAPPTATASTPSGSQQRTFSVEEIRFDAPSHKRSRRSSGSEEQFTQQIFSQSTFTPYMAETTSSNVAVASQTTTTTTTTTTSTAASTTASIMPILPPLPLQETATSTTTTVVGEQLHADCFEIALPYFDNAVCREILPLFHNVEVTPAEFAMRLHHAAPALMMRARLDKVQDMRELIIQLYKTRYYKKNSPEDSYFATTQRFFYPSEEVWRAFGDADAADAFMECEKHINCTFCGSDTVFKLRNNCGQYLDGEERELKLRPHRHDAMHHFLKRIIAEKLWCWQRLPESFM